MSKHSKLRLGTVPSRQGNYFKQGQCRSLSPSLPESKPAIIVMKIVNKNILINLLRQGKMLKGANVYLNEHLTKNNVDIARKARYLCKEKKIKQHGPLTVTYT